MGSTAKITSAPLKLGDFDREQTDGAQPDNSHRIAKAQIGIADAVDGHVSRLEAQRRQRIKIVQFPDQPGRRLGKAGPDEIGRTIDGDDVGLADVQEAEDAIADLPVAYLRPTSMMAPTPLVPTCESGTGS